MRQVIKEITADGNFLSSKQLFKGYICISVRCPILKQWFHLSFLDLWYKQITCVS